MQDRGLSSSCLCILYMVCAGACVFVFVWDLCVRMCMRVCCVVSVHVCGRVVCGVCMYVVECVCVCVEQS